MTENNAGDAGPIVTDAGMVCFCCGRDAQSLIVIHGLELCDECATDLMADSGCPCGGCGG